MSDTLKIGSVASLHRYPVKSMLGEDLQAAHVGAKGLQGDRVFALADPAGGKIASAKNPWKWPRLFQFRAAFTGPLPDKGALPPARITFPDGTSALTSDATIADRLAEFLGRPVRFLAGAPQNATLEEYWPDIAGLARQDTVTDEPMPEATFFDCAAIHLLTTGTLESLGAAYPEARFAPRRFRPNLLLQTGAGVGKFPENDWAGRVLRLGDGVKLKITGPCGRCVMTTLAQEDLPADTGILKAAVQQNRAHVGAYASVLQGGTVRNGDAVWLEAA